MKVRYIGESDPMALLNGKVYDVSETYEVDGETFFMVIDETGEDYSYEPELFEIVEE